MVDLDAELVQLICSLLLPHLDPFVVQVKLSEKYLPYWNGVKEDPRSHLHRIIRRLIQAFALQGSL